MVSSMTNNPPGLKRHIARVKAYPHTTTPSAGADSCSGVPMSSSLLLGHIPILDLVMPTTVDVLIPHVLYKYLSRLSSIST
jgi:hypothetical protein